MYGKEEDGEVGKDSDSAIHRWADEFCAVNARALNTLGAELYPRFVPPDAMGKIKKRLMEEQFGKAKLVRETRGSTRLSTVATRTQEDGYLKKIWDGEGREFNFTVIPSAPYALTAKQMLVRARKVAEAHLLVRSAVARIVNERFKADDLWRRNIYGGNIGLIGKKSFSRDIVGRYPQLADGRSPYMRFDVVPSVQGTLNTVDITPKSGGYNWWARKAQLVSQEMGVPPFLCLGELGKSISYLKRRSGLNDDDMVAIVGGDYLAGRQLDMEAACASTRVIRIPVVSNYIPTIDDTQNYLHEITILEDDNGVRIGLKDGRTVALKGFGFWYGYEHLGKGDSRSNKSLEQYFVLMGLAAKGKLVPLNVPIGMQALEAKLMSMVTGSVTFRRLILGRLEEIMGSSEARETLNTVMATVPESHLVQVDREGEILKYHTDNDTWSRHQRLSDITSKTHEVGTYEDKWLIKPIGGFGARGMLEGNLNELQRNVTKKEGVIYELQRAVRGLSWGNLLLPHGYDLGEQRVLTAQHLSRLEVYFTPTYESGIDLVGVSQTFMPGKSQDDGIKIHGSMNAFNVFFANL